MLDQEKDVQDFSRHHLEKLDDLPAHWCGGTVAIGNFDGVHLGHQTVLAAARTRADQEGGPCILLTFEPHPRQFFQPDVPLFRLSPPVLKASLALACGLDGTLIVPFNQDLQMMSAADFVSGILVDKLQIKHAITGYDFHFGHKRQGTPEFLEDAGRTSGFGVTIVDEFDEGGEAVSSTRIRQSLEEGDIGAANQLLDWSWSITGTISHGEKRGRALGFPTANIATDPGTKLRYGIYAVTFHRSNGEALEGVASFGRRPTFDNGAPVLEVYVFDFDGDLYGEAVRVAFHQFLRPELKFDGEAALISQMQDDCAAARAVLADQRENLGGLQKGSPIDRRLEKAWPLLAGQMNNAQLV